jgi:hypothetical protein
MACRLPELARRDRYCAEAKCRLWRQERKWLMHAHDVIDPERKSRFAASIVSPTSNVEIVELEMLNDSPWRLMGVISAFNQLE